MMSGLCKCGRPHMATKRQCLRCHAAYMRNWRKTHRPTAEQRRRSNARSTAKVYQRRGKLVKQPCEVCGSPDSVKHHDDYSKPLDVRWLCRPHHAELHRKLRAAPQHVEHFLVSDRIGSDPTPAGNKNGRYEPLDSLPEHGTASQDHEVRGLQSQMPHIRAMQTVLTEFSPSLPLP